MWHNRYFLHAKTLNKSDVTLRNKWPKYWSLSFSFSISSSNDNSGLISLRIDWFDLFAVQVTLTKASNLQCSALFMVELFLPYMKLWQIEGKTMETVTVFILGDSKITVDMTAAMKLKNNCSLEENL